MAEIKYYQGRVDLVGPGHAAGASWQPGDRIALRPPYSGANSNSVSEFSSDSESV